MIEKEKLTKEEAIRRHRELWNKIAELIEDKDSRIVDDLPKYHYCAFINGVDKIKQTALEVLGYSVCAVESHCWCCEYSSQLSSSWTTIPQSKVIKYKCEKYCPINWGTAVACVGSCMEPESPYKNFEIAVFEDSYKEAIQYAREVANLPERG